MTQIDAEDYATFTRYLQDCCGLVLGDNRQYLVASRLARLASESGFGSVGELVRSLRARPGGPLAMRVIDAMTTNETSWFRDVFPFDVFRDVILPDLWSRGRKMPRVWTAACSSGQEPYSLAMVTAEWERKTGQRTGLSILGTDLSERILEEADKATYDGLAMVRGLSDERRRQFFDAVDSGHRIKPDLRRRVRFQKLNLLDNLSSLGRFDVIFCRNVLIYFAPETKTKVLESIAQRLEPDGYFFVGASESVTPYTDLFRLQRTPAGAVLRLSSFKDG
ncbi:MAG: CheR family methyltransferase [Thioalkalivibrionaceae bacterium]